MKRFSQDFIRKEWRLLVIALIALLVVLMLMAVPSCGNYRDDCMAEEVVEELIDYETGLDIDLTPSSPERP